MRWRYVASLMVAALSEPARAATFETVEEALAARKTCIETFGGASDRLGTMLATWYTDERSSLQIARNFEVVRQGHEAFLADVGQFAKEPPGAAPQDLVALEKAIVALDKTHEDILTKHAEARAAEEAFIASLPPLAAGLDEVQAEFADAVAKCEVDPELRKTAESGVSRVGELKLQTARLEAYASQAAAKRLQVFEVILASKKISLLKNYAATAGRDLEGLRAEVSGALAAASLAVRVEKWWQEAAVLSGAARGALTRDLQFTRALRILAEDAQQAAEFEKELGRLAAVPADTRRMIAADLAARKELLERQRQELARDGWQKVLAKQKTMTARRKAVLDQYVPACAKMIAAYEKAAEVAVDIDAFAAAESAYRAQVATCVRRSP